MTGLTWFNQAPLPKPGELQEDRIGLLVPPPVVAPQPDDKSIQDKIAKLTAEKDAATAERDRLSKQLENESATKQRILAAKPRQHPKAHILVSNNEQPKQPSVTSKSEGPALATETYRNPTIDAYEATIKKLNGEIGRLEAMLNAPPVPAAAPKPAASVSSSKPTVAGSSAPAPLQYQKRCFADIPFGWKVPPEDRASMNRLCKEGHDSVWYMFGKANCKCEMAPVPR